MSRAGSRTEKIAIERESRTPDGAGGFATSGWVLVAEMWAEVQWIGATEGSDRGGQRSTSKYRFTVMSDAAHEAGVTPKDRIAWNGDLYNIRERPRRLPREPYTEIIAEAGVTQ